MARRLYAGGRGGAPPGPQHGPGTRARAAGISPQPPAFLRQAQFGWAAARPARLDGRARGLGVAARRTRARRAAAARGRARDPEPGSFRLIPAAFSFSPRRPFVLRWT